MNIYDLLKKKQKKIRLSSSEEYKFYLKNQKILEDNTYFLKKNNLDNSFQLVVANIYIRSLMNKRAIEDKVYEIIEKKGGIDKVNKGDLVKEVGILLKDMPYLVEEESKIYVPIFSKSLNIIYEKEPYRFLTYPYNNLKNDYIDSIIDPLETYGYSLFDSFFTKLVKIGEGHTCAAFFSIDYLTIYIINNQGRLDVMIPLFDKYLKRIDTSNVLTRAQAVVVHYFNNDRSSFINELYNQKLISSKMYHLIIKSRK